jgi:excisionase family DNA binding protein
MSDYEGKLGEWLKYVQQQVESVGTPEDEKAESGEKPKIEAQNRPPVDNIPRDVVIRDRLGDVFASDANRVDSGSIIGDFSLIDDGYPTGDRGPRLFEDSDIPNVEDYLPFLRDKVEEVPEPPVPEVPSKDQRLLNLSEGTGEPKPVIKPRVQEPPVVRAEAPAPVEQARPKQEYTAPTVPTVEPVAKVETPRAKPARKIAPPTASVDPTQINEMWNHLPRHIQLLAGQQREEIAQNSYKRFKESREGMIGRLLDPTISLEEAARILNVCPTTVRRYTNKGALQHLRTAGNQRRFRLSDVLTFLDSSTRGPARANGVRDKDAQDDQVAEASN